METKQLDDDIFLIAKLKLTKEGLCKGVTVNGIELPCVAAAQIVSEPEKITKLVVEIYVSSVETTRVRD